MVGATRTLVPLREQKTREKGCFFNGRVYACTREKGGKVDQSGPFRKINLIECNVFRYNYCFFCVCVF